MIEAEASGDGSSEADGAHGSAFLQLNAVEQDEDGQIGLVFESELDSGDFCGIAVAEIGDVAVFDLAVFSAE